jgi:hypothetical protein
MSRLFSLLVFVGACGDVEDPHDHHDHEHELITTVELTFSAAGADSFTAIWTDPENDGSPEVDDISLTMGMDYDVTVRFLNELESPAEDISPEILDEADQHQVFFTGTAVQGPAMSDNPDAVVEHAYGDEDSDGLPLGLENDLSTLGTGEGTFVVTLRHMPLESGTAVKNENAASDVASGGFGAIGGDNDVEVTFSLTVE